MACIFCTSFDALCKLLHLARTFSFTESVLLLILIGRQRMGNTFKSGNLQQYCSLFASSGIYSAYTFWNCAIVCIALFI